MRFLKRHSILAGAILLLLAVILTMVLTGRSKEEPEPFLRESPSSAGPDSSSSAVSLLLRQPFLKKPFPRRRRCAPSGFRS